MVNDTKLNLCVTEHGRSFLSLLKLRKCLLLTVDHIYHLRFTKHFKKERNGKLEIKLLKNLLVKRNVKCIIITAIKRKNGNFILNI